MLNLRKVRATSLVSTLLPSEQGAYPNLTFAIRVYLGSLNTLQSLVFTKFLKKGILKREQTNSYCNMNHPLLV